MTVRASHTTLWSLSASNLAHGLASQINVQALVTLAPSVRASSLILEILVWNHVMTIPPLFPALPGLSFPVIKRAVWFNATQASASGREVRVAYANAPLWEWDLTWEYLPDYAAPGALTPSDLRTLMGFLLAQSGSLNGFLYEDVDDHSVSNQWLGTTDGGSSIWTLVRSYGGAAGSGVEPIGYVNASQPFSLYLDGVLVDPASYDVLSTTPVSQQIKFHTTPAAGHAITAAFDYYFYVRLKDDHVEVEKFLAQLWSQRQITLRSLRG